MARVLTLFLAALITSNAALAAAGLQTPGDDEALMRRYAERLAPGTVVAVQTKDGERFTAVLMDVTPEGVVLKPRTRLPEPARTVPFTSLESLEPKAAGLTLGRAAAIGAGAGAACFGALFFIVAALVHD